MSNLKLLSVGTPIISFFQHQEVANLLHPHIDPFLREMEGAVTRMDDIALALAGQILKGVENQRFRKNEAQFTIPFQSEYREITLPFSFAAASKGNKIKLSLILAGQRYLGKGAYGNVKKSLSITCRVKNHHLIHISSKESATKRICKKFKIEQVSPSHERFHQMASLLKSTAALLGESEPLLVRQKERVYESKTGQKRLELEMPRFAGDLQSQVDKIEMEKQLDCLLDISQTLFAMHRNNFIHHDLTRKNILIRREKNRPRAYIADFDRLQKMGSDLVFNYWAWDQVSEKGLVTPASDLFGFATLILDTLLEGETANDIVKERHRLYTQAQQSAEFTRIVFEKAKTRFKGTTLFPDLIQQKMTKNSSHHDSVDDGIKILTELELKPSLSSRERKILSQFKKDLQTMGQAFSLVIRIFEADRHWFQKVMDDEALKKQNPAHVSLADKIRSGDTLQQKDVLIELYKFFPTTEELTQELCNIRCCRAVEAYKA